GRGGGEGEGEEGEGGQWGGQQAGHAAGTGERVVRADRGADGRADDLEQRAGQEQPAPGPPGDGGPVRVRLEVAGVIRRIGVPADRVAERGAERQQERAGNRVV